MPFTFKLSKRLALMKASLVPAAAAVLVACQLQDKRGVTGPTLPSSSVVQVVLSPKTFTLQTDDVTQLTAVGLTAAGDTGAIQVNWSVTGGSIVDTSSSGGKHYSHYKAGPPGQYKVMARSGSLTDTATITVTNVPVASVMVSPASASVTVGQTVQLTATPKDASGTPLSGRVVTWATSNAAVTTVSGSGLVTGGAVGTATVTATSEGQSGTATIAVSNVPVVSVTVSPATASVPVGQTVQLTATPKDASGTPLSGRVVTWATSNAVSTVNGSGLVTGVAVGSATITATSEGKSGTTAITVTAPVTAPGTVTDLAVVSVTDNSVTLSFTEVNAGTGQPASYDIRWAAGALSWSSAAEVTSGSCTTPVVGSAIGATRSCTVLGLAASTGYQFQLVAFRGTLNVNAVFGALSPVASGTTAGSTAPVASVTVSPATASVSVGQSVQLVATPKDAAGSPLSGRVVTWASGNATVATVSGSGLVAGVVAGAATITATSEGQNGTAAITVTMAGGGGTVLLQEAFEDNAFATRGWYDNTGMAITAAEHIAGSTRALEAHFPAGATTPTWGGAARHLFQPTPTLYISYWVKYSTNWVGSGHLYHPHEFLVMSDLDGDWDGPSNGWLVAYVEHNYQNGGIPRLSVQDSKAINTTYGTPPINLIGITENRSVGGCNGVVEPNVVVSCFSFPPWYNDKEITAPQVWFQPTPGPGYKSNWNHVEAYFQINSIVNGIGQADGVAQYWFNGTLVIDRHDILFRTGARPSINFHQFLIAPYIGDGSPVDQYLWVDDLTVATSKP